MRSAHLAHAGAAIRALMRYAAALIALGTRLPPCRRHAILCSSVSSARLVTFCEVYPHPTGTPSDNHPRSV